MYIQMVGRALRPYPNKIDTIILDHSGAVYEHGFPEDAGNWSLKTTTRKEKEKITKEKVEKKADKAAKKMGAKYKALGKKFAKVIKKAHTQRAAELKAKKSAEVE